MTDWIVRPLQAADHESWRALYTGYRRFYEYQDDHAVLDRTWGWLSAGEHGLRGLVAARGDGTLGALAHFRTFARPASASLGLYLDDLFSAPEHRGQGLASLLLRELSEIAAAEKASVVRWITASDNGTARSVYDKTASATRWVTYDMSPAEGRGSAPAAQ